MASLMNRVRVHSGAIWSIKWIPDGKRKLIATGGTTLCVWEFFDEEEEQDSQLLHKWRDNTLQIVSIDIAQREADVLILSSSLDGNIRVYSFVQGTLVNRISCGSCQCWQISVFGNMVATGTNTGVPVIHEIVPSTEEPREPIRLEAGQKGFALSTQFSKDGTKLAVGYAKENGGRQPNICVYDVESETKILDITGPCDSIRQIQWGATSEYMFVASQDLRVHFVVVKEGRIKYQFSGHRGWVSAVTISPDQQRIASASTDGRLKVWEITTGQPVVTCQNHEGAVWDCSYSPTGEYLATCGEDGWLYCYRIPQT